MTKYAFILISFLFLFEAANAQKDTSVYFLKSTGKFVSTKDSADFIRLIISPDTAVDKSLFEVKEFYMNGKIKAIGKSKTDNFNMVLQGSYIAFFPNGHKRRIESFENGRYVGDVTTYYPNGKLHSIERYSAGDVLYLKCADSTGTILTENGNGKWIEFLGGLDEVVGQGEVKDGQLTGAMVYKKNDSVVFIRTYNNGRIVGEKIANETEYKKVVKISMDASFPGGYLSFTRFISHNTRYPNEAEYKGTKGTVIVSFFIEKDGTVSGVKIEKGLGDGCDEEALRAVKRSPKWKPAMEMNELVRAHYSISVKFPPAD